MEDGEKSQGESLRNGEGTDGLQGCCMRWIWKSQFEVGMCALFWEDRRRDGRVVSASSGSAKVRIEGVLEASESGRIEERSRGLL